MLPLFPVVDIQLLADSMVKCVDYGVGKQKHDKLCFQKLV